MMRLTVHGVAFCAAILMASEPARAACTNTGNFGTWLADFRKEAAAAGISQSAISSGLDGVTFDPKVVSRDRRQGVFAQSFLKFFRSHGQ